MARQGGQISVAARIALALPYIWLAVFFLAPFAIVARISLSQQALAQPPYLPLFSWSEGLAGLWEHLAELSPAGFSALLEDGLYADGLITSLRIAAVSTLASLCVAYPMALGIARAPEHWRNPLILLAIAPFWTSFLIRIYAWIAILKDEGFLNHGLMQLGLIHQPLPLFASETAVVIGIVYSYLPFMILPLIGALTSQSPALAEAASDLGASRFAAFWTITFPLSLPGARAGALLVFIPAMGEVVIPDLLGGSGMLMIGRILWNDFFANRDWPAAACGAILLLAVLVGPILAYQRNQAAGAARQ